MTISQQIQHAADATPAWANWSIIVGSAVAAWIQPIAGIVAIAWGLLQIYGWVEKRWFAEDKR